jgi:ABC-type Na+ transport system ATPase subunit NatA
VLGLVGPNGAGKNDDTALPLRHIAPTLGTVTIAGHDIQVAPVAAKQALAFHSGRAAPLRSTHRRGTPALHRAALRRGNVEARMGPLLD